MPDVILQSTQIWIAKNSDLDLFVQWKPGLWAGLKEDQTI